MTTPLPVLARRAPLFLGGLLGFLAAPGCGPGEAAPPPPPLGPAVAIEPSAARSALIEEARALGREDDWSGAEAALTRWAGEHGEDGELLTLLSEAARKQGDTERALAFAERAVAALPDSSAAHLQQARALAEKLRSAGVLGAMRSIGPWKEALARARALDPANLEARTDEIAFHLIAPGLVGGSKERGLALARELLALDEERGLPLLVWALSADGQQDEALRTAREALEARPERRKLRMTYARLLQEDAPAQAEAEMQRIVDEAREAPGERDESYYEALYQLARGRIEAEREPERAIAMLEEYLAEAPRADQLPPKAGAWWRIGNAHELLGRNDAARAAYEAALALDPAFERARDALDALD